MALSIKHREKIQNLWKREFFGGKFAKDRRTLKCFSTEQALSIGTGSNGTSVFVGILDDDTEVAVKRMLVHSCEALAENETKILKLIDTKKSPFIVSYRHFFRDSTFMYLVVDLCEETLKDHVLSPAFQPLRHDRRMIKEILTGLAFLHNEGVLHRDLKPSNVLVDVIGHLKLADFGISRVLNDDETTVLTEAKGTQGWMAREVIETMGQVGKGRFKKKSDVQVAGMIVHFILTKGGHPFGPPLERMVNIVKGNPVNLDKLDDLDDHYFVSWLVSHEIEDRPYAHLALGYLHNGNCQGQLLFWTGTLKWQQSIRTEAGRTTRVPRVLSCSVFIPFAGFITDTWAKELIMQLIPQHLLASLWTLLHNSKRVNFKFLANDSLNALNGVMATSCDRFVGYVRSMNASQRDVKVLLLMFSSRKRAFFGLIPKDQKKFMGEMKKVIEDQKKQQLLDEFGLTFIPKLRRTASYQTAPTTSSPIAPDTATTIGLATAFSARAAARYSNLVATKTAFPALFVKTKTATAPTPTTMKAIAKRGTLAATATQSATQSETASDASHTSRSINIHRSSKSDNPRSWKEDLHKKNSRKRNLDGRLTQEEQQKKKISRADGNLDYSFLERRSDDSHLFDL